MTAYGLQMAGHKISQPRSKGFSLGKGKGSYQGKCLGNEVEVRSSEETVLVVKLQKH